MSPVVRILLRIAYWLAVLAVSVAILIVLILLIESRDKSNVRNDSGQARASAAPELPGSLLLPDEAGKRDDPVRGAVERMARA